MDEDEDLQHIWLDGLSFDDLDYMMSSLFNLNQLDV